MSSPSNSELCAVQRILDYLTVDTMLKIRLHSNVHVVQSIGECVRYVSRGNQYRCGHGSLGIHQNFDRT